MIKEEKNSIPQVVYLINIKFIQVNSQFKMLEMKYLKQHFNCGFLQGQFLGETLFHWNPMTT